MVVNGDFIDSIGNTRLIRLNGPSELTGCEILGKAEYENPGGSVKDRAAWWIIKDAEASGKIESNGTVVEGTAGNTGIGLAHICNARDYACVIYIPDNQSQEKIEILESLEAEVRQVPPVPYKNEMNYQKQAGRYAATLSNGFWANQFDNKANTVAHYESTGPEIWEATNHQVDAFVCAAGTGGTIAGVSKYLKEKNSDVQIVLSDCMGSALHNIVTTGEAVMSEGPSITEGIGNSRVTDNFAEAQVDWAVQIPDQDMVDLVYKLREEEDLFLGSSSGINVCGAIEVAKKLGPGHTVVTMLCDTGDKYMSSLYNADFLREKNLSVPSN